MKGSKQNNIQQKQLQISSETLDNYYNFKKMLQQITGRENISDDEILLALIEGFMHSYLHQGNTHKNDSFCCNEQNYNSQNTCCGGGCCC